MYHGDILLGDTIDLKFTTVDSTGAPTTLAGSPVISAYVGNSTTEITAGITLTVDFDSRTGMHNVRVVASGGNGYAAATNVVLALTAGTVSGVSVVGYVVGSFSIQNRIVAAVSGAVGSVTGAVGGAVGSVTGNVGGNVVGSVGSVTGNVGGNVVGNVGSLTALAANSVNASALAADAVAEIVTGVLTTAMTESYNADGAAPTVAQALMLAIQMLSEASVSGTTLTVKKLDGSTTAMTFTLNSATTPTSITRAT